MGKKRVIRAMQNLRDACDPNERRFYEVCVLSVFFLADGLEKAGKKEGLPRKKAKLLARATVSGSASLLARESKKTPAVLRSEVTSPGGTTEAAIEVLEKDDILYKLLKEALRAEPKT